MIKNTFAITYSVKNEARLLPNAIRYHMAAGCSKIYVFLDGTTDNVVELIDTIRGVEIAESRPPTGLAGEPEWFKRIVPIWSENMDARKRVNTYRAAQMARDAGIEWLISIDPDELLLPALNSSVAKNLMPDFLNTIPDDVDQILLRNLELLPTGATSENPFLDGLYFLNRFPLTEKIFRYYSAFTRKIVRSPLLHAWCEHGFYRMRFMGEWPRVMCHPVSGAKIPTPYFLGYSNCKSAIRTASIEAFHFNIHRWYREAREPRSVSVGHVLHYDLFDYKYMVAKFGQRSHGYTQATRVFHCRYMFGVISRECTEECVERFFSANIAVSSGDKIDKLMKKGVVSKVDCISKFFRGAAC